MILSQAAKLGGSSTTVTNVAPAAAGGSSGRRLLGLPRCCPDFSINVQAAVNTLTAKLLS